MVILNECKQFTRMTEEEWWEKFLDIATRQWELVPRFNYILRKDYISEMKSFLFVPKGKLLEVGCGSGWVGIEVAKSGMELFGIDTSPSQINNAKKRAKEAGLVDPIFTVGTMADLDSSLRFDSVIIHAVLHHLAPDEIPTFFKQITALLKKHGRLYIYEPVSSGLTSPWINLCASVIFFLFWSPFWLLQKIGSYFRVGPKKFREAVKNGWSGFSPNEAPVDKSFLLNIIEKSFSIDRLYYWHAYSLAFAMGCTELKPPFSWLAEWLTYLLYWVDQRLMKSSLRDHLIGVWTWASITAVRL